MAIMQIVVQDQEPTRYYIDHLDRAALKRMKEKYPNADEADLVYESFTITDATDLKAAKRIYARHDRLMNMPAIFERIHVVRIAEDPITWGFDDQMIVDRP